MWMLPFKVLERSERPLPFQTIILHRVSYIAYCAGYLGDRSGLQQACHLDRSGRGPRSGRLKRSGEIATEYPLPCSRKELSKELVGGLSLPAESLAGKNRPSCRFVSIVVNQRSCSGRNSLPSHLFESPQKRFIFLGPP